MVETRKSVLFFTNSEHGQANVMLAVAYEFLLRNEFDIHIATFSDGGPRISLFNEAFVNRQRAENESFNSIEMPAAGKGRKTTPEITFHPVVGRSMRQAFDSRPGFTFEHGVGDISATLETYKTFIDVVLYWTPDEYIETYKSCVEIIKTVQPSFAVCEPVFYAGRDAITNNQVPYAMLSPTCFKDFVLQIQPKIAGLWKYPASCTGYRFPLPWYRIPPNLYCIIGAIRTIFKAGKITSLNEIRVTNGILGKMPFKNYSTTRLHLCPSLPETEYPMFIPDNVIGCGPIVLPSIPLSDTDKELGQWLGRGPTVLICLGTQFETNSSFVTEMAKGLVLVMDQQPNIQILWKIKGAGATSEEFHNIMDARILSGKVKITDWLVPDIMSILDTGNIVSFVNHGGGNSYHEGCRAGIPQVVLPAWFDTYEFADRVRWLGIGVWGNEGVAPGVEAVQFSKALMGTLTEANMIARAREIGELCRKSEGRKMACELISRSAKSSYNHS